ncbi:MAG: 2OG-Fe(II) oxygenase [Gammaproteobacteria bacterium CG_4_10_14_0_8_um_filter_38_16]|nr:MAG: 2OG-Fe(II) oxygenase [Gammaproteobacteria bacterium CG_4_10_14_0_8_um_filter_38_16]PJA03662.1 MAG: 2OG-Fe(II) oxygenase [Gammaproteobacteria bacterium CG_4_10_14_0_2_um_filter_38_22]PJB11328.1 MAG: 2OG-Fe(II) oxygenase [Gammaproteobacteria bacterium CG_4_9_14_3_um_filter_38_9]
MSIRVIDFRSPTAAAEFAAGLKEIGFAVISNHPVSQALINQAYEQWYAFFKSDEKKQFTFNPETQDGYISKELSETAKGYDQKDLKEFYHYYKGQRCPASCFDVTSKLSDALTSLAGILLSWVNDHAPSDVQSKFSMPLPDMIKNSDRILFRLIHYPPLTGNEPVGAIRAAAHEDINLLTMLPAATAEGLQVQDASGNWLDVPINPGWIIINAGDMLQECSGHYYKSTSHRVLNPTGEAAKKSRLSLPLFLHPRSDVVLSEKYTAASYLNERLKELGLL